MAVNLGKNYEKLPALLKKYEKLYADFPSDSDVSGKTVAEVSTTNHSMYGFYEERAIELKHVMDYLEMRRVQLHGKLYQSYKKGSNISLNEREIHQYIKSDDLYVDISIMILEVKELHEKFQSAVTAFKNIGYGMNNLTKLLIAELEKHTL